MPSSREQQIQCLCACLKRLLDKEEDPQATMWLLQDRLLDSWLRPSLSKESTEQFALDLETALLVENPDNWTFPHQSLSTIETAEELILSMLKGEWDS